MRNPARENDWPLVTVIMPVRNEARFIARSLGAVLNQDYPPERLQIIVVDGMSTDGTREKVERLRRRGVDLCLIDNPGVIVPTGLNAALRLAKGEVIVRVDGHCEIAPDYVRRCVAHLESGEADGVGGPLETVGTGIVAQAIARAMSSPFGVGGSAFRTVRDRALYVDTIAFPAYTRRIVEMAGPFDEELVRNQDDEYNYRLRKLGARLLLAPDVRARYYSRSSFRSLWRQYLQYGYWKVRVLQKHPAQMRWRQFVPPLFVFAIAVASILAPFDGGSSLMTLGLVYSASAIACALYEGRSYPTLMPLVALAFATMHLAYGIGFWVGLIKFRRLWRPYDAEGSVHGSIRG
ncbi:glycosyltransferase family 2 protein [Pyrinomonas methylaliphatogenes]|uniref:Glycosyl transferase n=1 Tax=Pyrinomonas methylaliphatogenes TaxID=454194 RepID=A0A0B6WY32_9BACT|nr:glycosyltransferase family 2 protein [Pyrinomonas methylaliphatogenes]CDM65199.1 glycosyl transferase [Pyrinomonas methylaliphatogenes]